MMIALNEFKTIHPDQLGPENPAKENTAEFLVALDTGIRENLVQSVDKVERHPHRE